MEQVRLGEEEFSIGHVIRILKTNETSFNEILCKWVDFGYNLRLMKAEIKSLRKKSSSDGYDLQDILRDILIIWKNTHGEEATLKVLYDALVLVDAEDTADILRAEFLGGVSGDDTVVLDEKQSGGAAVESEISLYRCEPLYFDEPEDELLRAIFLGESTECILNILNRNVSTVNVVDASTGSSAMHYVMVSLRKEEISHERAMEIMNLLMNNNFNRINDKDIYGYTPLHLAMRVGSLEVEFLTWFGNHGADFQAVDNFGFSVLFHAIFYIRDGGLLRHLIHDFGCNAHHFNGSNLNAVHCSALYGNPSALKLFIEEEKVDLGAVSVWGESPLHLLFLLGLKEFDYQGCLEILLKVGADFGAKDEWGDVPLVRWIKNGKTNPFPTLVQMKDQLPITNDISSDALTVIIEKIERLQKFLPSSSEEAPNEFAQFIILLIQEKEAKLRLKLEERWKQLAWADQVRHILKRDEVEELSSGRFEWGGDRIWISATVLGKLDFHYNSNNSVAQIEVEAVFACLLKCKKYQRFVDFCQIVKEFIVAE